MSRFHSLEIDDVRRETPDSVSIRFRVPDALRPAFAFKPGQYLTLRADIGGEDIRRSYSICSGVQDRELRVGIRRVPGGAFSTYASQSLAPGDRLDVMTPEGRFTPESGAEGRRYLGIAAGSGITPVLSIAKSRLSEDPTATFTLIYGNRTARSAMFAEDIEDLKNRHLRRFSVIHILSREASDMPLFAGRVTAAKLAELNAGAVRLAEIDEAFLCGPEGMVAEARAALQGFGVPAGRIKAELFTPSAPRRTGTPASSAEAGAAPQARVTVMLDGKRQSFDLLASDESLVDAAHRQGIELPYSCKGGMCCTCRCRVESGEAEMAVNYSLEAWEIAAGFTLACQARPKTPELALDFDDM
jgi:ring-1,2-phenylacetyl-CoA epoxidase subunit PaaE